MVEATSPNLSFLFKIFSMLSTLDMAEETVEPNLRLLCFIFSKSSADMFLVEAPLAPFPAAGGVDFFSGDDFLPSPMPKRAARASFELKAPLEVLTPYFSARNLRRSASES